MSPAKITGNQVRHMNHSLRTESSFRFNPAYYGVRTQMDPRGQLYNPMDTRMFVNNQSARPAPMVPAFDVADIDFPFPILPGQDISTIRPYDVIKPPVDIRSTDTDYRPYSNIMQQKHYFSVPV